jgi:hypothetical protein
LRQQARVGDIYLLFGDESEALIHPFSLTAEPGVALICGSADCTSWRTSRA